jgi:muconolactone D-isomerase
MLFLVIDKVKVDFVPVEMSLAQLKMLSQTFAMYKDYKENGKLKEMYAFADNPGGITIWDVESNEELQKTLFLLPTMPFMEREVRPITSLDSAIGVVRELTEIVKSMPAGPSK